MAKGSKMYQWVLQKMIAVGLKSFECFKVVEFGYMLII